MSHKLYNLHIADCEAVLAGDVMQLISAFWWSDTPQGYDFWDQAYESNTLDAPHLEALQQLITAHNGDTP